jgi:hypothetical protein
MRHGVGPAFFEVPVPHRFDTAHMAQEPVWYLGKTCARRSAPDRLILTKYSTKSVEGNQIQDKRWIFHYGVPSVIGDFFTVLRVAKIITFWAYPLPEIFRHLRP